MTVGDAAPPADEAQLSRPRDRIKIVLLEGVHERAVQLLHGAGYTDVERLTTALSGEDLVAALEGARMVGLRSRTQLTADVLDRCPRLMAVGCFCIGTNQVDLGHARRRGVPVFHAPHSNTRSVAELVIGLAVMLFRGVFPRSTAAHRGEWRKSAAGSHEVRGKTIGIVGYGHIGSQVSVLAEALGMRVVYHDIVPRLALGNAQAATGLSELLAESDLVSLHVPETPQTRGMFGAAEFAAMKQGACFVNASRGTVVDVDALAAALGSGHVSGAAVDVFPREPRTKGEEFESVLRGMDNVILTPHIGGSTEEAQWSIAGDVVAQLLAYSDRGDTTAAVNFPQLSLAPHAGCHRILHVHANRPGVLSRINDVVAAADLNIVGQHLQTRGGVGYVVLDVDRSATAAVLPALRAVDGTVRARILY